MQDRLPIGTITGPHGLQGDMRVALRHRVLLPEGTVVWIGFSPSFGREFMLKAFSLTQRYGLLHLHGVETREAAEKLREQGVFVAASLINSQGYTTPMGMEGWSVVVAEGTVIGTVVGTEDNPAHPLLRIERPSGDELLLPYVEEFITNADAATRTLTINPPAGLLELSLPAQTIVPSKRKR